MKIIFLNFYQASRGLETFVNQLSAKLQKKHQVLSINGSRKTVSVRDPITFFQRLFLDMDSLKIGFWTLKKLQQIKKFHPDIIIPTNGGWQSLIISIFSRLIGAKTIITGQSGMGWDDRWNLICRPHVFVALTNSQQTWARRVSPWFKQKIVKIGNGVDTNHFQPQGKQVKLKLQKPIILMVSATVSYKRVEQGIVAVSHLKQGSLLLIGTGPLNKRVDNLGYKLLGKSRYTRISVPFDKIADYYRSADLFTLCSASSEAFGIVYLEAMASGLACIATDDKSRREIIGQAGFFVKDVNNPKEYSLALKKALQKNWKNLPQKQAEKFSWTTIAIQYNKLFTNIL